MKYTYIHSLNKLCNILNQMTIFPPRGIIGTFFLNVNGMWK